MSMHQQRDPLHSTIDEANLQLGSSATASIAQVTCSRHTGCSLLPPHRMRLAPATQDASSQGASKATLVG
eukprot:scaffold280648_cov32-Tisochrysis_lutea.AAC.1